MSEPALVELERASKLYVAGGERVAALHPLDLVIAPGELVCVAGPSGSGKTTLLNLVGAIDLPTAGTVRVAGQSTRVSRTERAKLRLQHVGFVFQSYNLVPVLSAFENVEYVLLLQGLPARERRARVLEALESVGLGAEAHRRPSALSGGQQQRVAVARALAGRPRLVVADEPTANLDSKTGEALLGLLDRLNRERGTTFVFSSHDPAVIRRAHRVLRLRDGRLEAPGS